MATDKNITMKQFNGTDYDTLYPKTIASQIPDVYSKSYIDSILKDSAKIQTGSYVGTGTYGANNPCTLTFDFIPALFIIYSFIQTTKINDTTIRPALPLWGKNTSSGSSSILYSEVLTNNYRKYDIQNGNASGNGNAKKVGNSLFWYHEYGFNQQYNNKEYTYYYLAIG